MTDTATDLLNAALKQIGKLRNALGDLVPLDLSDIVTPLATWPAGRLVVAPGQIASSAWGNTTYDQTVMTFANAADRDAQWPAPHEGSVCFLNDVKRMQMYANGAWGYKDLRCSRYHVSRTANGLASGAYTDVGLPTNTEWANGGQTVGVVTTLTMVKPALVLLQGNWSIGSVAGGLCTGEIAAFGQSLGNGFTYPQSTIQGNVFAATPTFVSLMNTGDVMSMRIRNNSAGAVNMIANTWITFADVNPITIQALSALEAGIV